MIDRFFSTGVVNNSAESDSVTEELTLRFLWELMRRFLGPVFETVLCRDMNISITVNKSGFLN
jgi:hypothetical protein